MFIASGFHFKLEMFVALLWLVSPNSEVPNFFGFLESVREGNRILDSSKFISRERSLICHSKIKKCKKQNLKYRSSSPYLSYSLTKGKSPISSNLVVNPAREMTISSEKKVYDVVLKQAALVKKQLKNAENYDVKPTLSLLIEAYDRCGEVCAEYAKTFYLGTLIMTREKRRAIWAIYVWCRRTDELVDGPNASHITSTALDRWESRIEDIFRGRPFDMLDAALSDTVTKFHVDIQPFKDMIEGMRMDLKKSRYKNFDELYLYCYYVGGTVGLMSVPIMGIAPETQATTVSVYSAALALGIANQLTNILRDVGEE